MRLLLDAHAFLWFVGGDPRLSASARASIEDPGNTRLLSIASLWEIAIKVTTGKLTLNRPFEMIFPHQLIFNDITLLDIGIDHVTAVTTLPLHHRDPFDRLLIAQAMVEDIPIVSADSAFDAYTVSRLW